MKHIRPISLGKAQDAFGYIFLQLWLTTFFALLTGAFSRKDK